MLGVGGWKTIVGALFGAFAIVLPQMKHVVDPIIYQWLMIISGFAGTFLTLIGIGHKIEKVGRKL